MEIQNILLLCGIIGGPLFIVIFLIEGYVRPGYNALRQPVSSLSIGERGWIQRANFIVTGALMFACAWGLRFALADGDSFWGPFLIGLYALALIGAGIFVTDITGMQSNAPKTGKRFVEGRLHDICSLFVFLCIFGDCFVFARLFAASEAWAWQIYSMGTAVLFGTGFMLFARGFAGAGKLPRLAGLTQRLTIAVGWLWVSAIAAHFLGA